MTIVNRLRSFLGRSDDISYQLYGALVTQARSPEFYSDAGVPDSLDGRFDMIVMHAYLVIRRLNQADDPGKALAQGLFDVMFQDMDQSLREIGAGDLSVPKKIKVMAKAFYGRCTAYESAMDAEERGAVGGVIERNIFAETEPPEGAVQAITDYMFETESKLNSQGNARLQQGKIEFPVFAMNNTDRT